MLERLDNRHRCVVRVLVERLAPDKGRVYDPRCGSASMFVQSDNSSNPTAAPAYEIAAVHQAKSYLGRVTLQPFQNCGATCCWGVCCRDRSIVWRTER